MSTYFTLRCTLCEVNGPDLRRSNGVTWVDQRVDNWEAAKRAGSDEAHDFLLEHEYHGGLVLVHEQAIHSERQN
jgi:hypothetical protein